MDLKFLEQLSRDPQGVPSGEQLVSITDGFIRRLVEHLAELQDRVTSLEEELELRERRDGAMRKNLERSAQALLSAANVEKKVKGRLPR